MDKIPLNLLDLMPAPARAKAQILEMIRNGQIPCGQKIDQRAIAKELKLTTAPVREALSSLEAEGLLKRIPGVGIFCRTYTVDEIEELIEIRGALEALAAARCAERIDSDSAKKLKDMAEKLSKADTYSDNKEYLQAHIEFHRFIAECAQSKQLSRLLDRNHIIQEVLSNISANIWPVEPHDHTLIAESICNRDPQKAEKVMRNHVAPTFKKRIEKLRKSYGNNPVI